jgi:D-alanyl-D-alanine carboxypeptidase
MIRRRSDRCRTLILVACSCLFLSAVAYASPQSGNARAVPPRPAPSSAYDAVLKRAVDAGGPGAAAIVVVDGKVVYRQAYGMASLELGVPLQSDMVFRLGSVTKQFTATAIMMLVEQGKVALADPIDKYLPGYPMQGHVITVEHLLTHTSGIQSYTDMPGWMANRIKADLTVKELVDGFKNEPMQFAPGTRYRYNNSGYVLLGAIIEKASGQSYESFVSERIFKPLGMTHSYYGSNEPVIPKRADGYTGQAGSPRHAQYLSMTQPYAAGSLVSTVDDLAIWDGSLYTEKLLKRASLEKMWTPYTLADGTSTGYGYGWQMGPLRGHRTVAHGGGIFGFVTYVMRLPDDRAYVAVLCNTDSPAATPEYLARRLGAIAVGRPFSEPVAVAVDPAVLQRYAGVYAIDNATTRTVTVENGKLYTQRTGAAKLEARPRSEVEFFYENRPSLFRFEVDAAGRAVAMVMFQEEGGQPERAVRVSEKIESRQAATVNPAAYDAYVGEYELAPGFILTVTREGDRLMTQATGQSKVEIFPSSETEFFLKVTDAQITFVKGPTGTVDQLVLHQGGRDMAAKRLK